MRQRGLVFSRAPVRTQLAATVIRAHSRSGPFHTGYQTFAMGAKSNIMCKHQRLSALCHYRTFTGCQQGLALAIA